MSDVSSHIYQAVREVITRRSYDRAVAATALAERLLQNEGAIVREDDEIMVGNRAMSKDRELLPRMSQSTGLGFALYAGNRRISVATVLDAHAASESPTMVHCHCHNLPASVPEKLWSREEFEALKAAGIVRPTPGTGACQSAPAALFRAVRGYDEKYRFWGSEDLDMSWRAEAFGARKLWISDRTAMVHQYHPSVRDDRKLRRRLNRLRYLLTRGRVVKNPQGWGNEP